MQAVLIETVAQLEGLARAATELAAVLPALDLADTELRALAGEVQRASGRLADAEERLVAAARCPLSFPHARNADRL